MALACNSAQNGFPIPQHPPYIPPWCWGILPHTTTLGKPHHWTLLDQWGNLQTDKTNPQTPKSKTSQPGRPLNDHRFSCVPGDGPSHPTVWSLRAESLA